MIYLPVGTQLLHHGPHFLLVADDELPPPGTVQLGGEHGARSVVGIPAILQVGECDGLPLSRKHPVCLWVVLADDVTASTLPSKMGLQSISCRYDWYVCNTSCPASK